MLIIDNALVSELLSMDECIEVQERAFGKIPSGEAAPRLDAPCEREDGRWGTMEGRIRDPHEIRRHHLAAGTLPAGGPRTSIASSPGAAWFSCFPPGTASRLR